MPRVTRAALRSQEVQEETDAASVPLPLTPKLKVRAPLGETSGNTSNAREKVNTNEEMAAAKKGPGKGKKGNASKRPPKPERNKVGEPAVDVIEDDNQSQASSAAEEACKDLLEGNIVSVSISDKVTVERDRPDTPPSAAVNEARLQLSSKPIKPHFDPEKHCDSETLPDNSTDNGEADVACCTPAKMNSVEEPCVTKAGDDGKEDSFVEQIKTRTPGRRISRIEDSVEALDALEDEIEMVGGLIPDAGGAQSPTNFRKHTNQPTNSKGLKANGSVRVKKAPVAPSTRKPTKPITTARSTTSRPSMQPQAKKITPSGSSTDAVANQKRDASVGKPATQSPISTEASQADLRKRVSSIHKTPFQPAKSTKAPTRAVFELPGEAVARRLKEQREERLKREEEKKPEQPTFKARPVRLSHAPEVKLTATAKARLSMAKGEPVNSTTASNDAPKIKPPGRTGYVAPTGAHKRLSSLSVNKRARNPPVANSSARVTRVPSFSAAAAPRNISASVAPRPAPTGEDLAHQKVKGKEVFGRTKVEIMEREKAKREKDEAIKKARAEAAEKGRAASRDWAEKQKLGKLEAAKANEGVKAVEA